MEPSMHEDSPEAMLPWKSTPPMFKGRGPSLDRSPWYGS
jgi:hypothetical protein